MNDTVAIALITALSTLSAAALTGLAAARQTARQLRHRLTLAREQRAEDRADTRRGIRRDAYERFLARADAAYRVLDEGWLAQPSTERPRWEAGFAARRSLDEAAIRVRLEGPEKVSESAEAVVRSIGREFRAYAKIVEAHPDAASSAAQLDQSARKSALEARHSTSADFLEASRLALT